MVRRRDGIHQKRNRRFPSKSGTHRKRQHSRRKPNPNRHPPRRHPRKNPILPPFIRHLQSLMRLQKMEPNRPLQKIHLKRRKLFIRQNLVLHVHKLSRTRGFSLRLRSPKMVQLRAPIQGTSYMAHIAIMWTRMLHGRRNQQRNLHM